MHKPQNLVDNLKEQVTRSKRMDHSSEALFVSKCLSVVKMNSCVPIVYEQDCQTALSCFFFL